MSAKDRFARLLGLSNSTKIKTITAQISELTSSGIDETARASVAQLILDLASTASGKGASDIGIEDAGTKITATTVEAALQEMATAIAARITTASIVNDLTTGGTAVPLSAEQGKTLNGLIGNLEDFISVSGSGTGNDTYACDVAGARVKNFAFSIADTDAKTVTLSNVPTGRCEVYLEITTTAAASVTWTLNSGSSLAWSGGSAPTIAANKVYRILFLTNDNGATWDGFASLGV